MALVGAYDYSTADGAASEAEGDYFITSGSLMFDPGVTELQVPVSIFADGLDEWDETFVLDISTPDGNGTIGDSQATATVTDGDPEPLLWIEDGYDDEPAFGDGTVELRVVLGDTWGSPHASAKTVTVDWATADGSAVASSDYAAASGTLTFDPAVTEQTIVLTLLDDHEWEAADEEFSVLLSNAVNAGLGDGSASVTIVDDEPFASVSWDWDADEDGAFHGQFTVHLSEPPSSDVTVSYTVGGSATGGTDYAPLSGSVVVTQGTDFATILVTPIDDPDVEGDEDVVVTLQPGTGYGLNAGVDDQASLLIYDEDIHRTAWVSWLTDAYEDGPSDGQLTVWLSEAADSNLAVSYTVGGSATAGDDYATLSGSVVVPQGSDYATITVSPVDDSEEEGDEDVVVTLQAGTGYALDGGESDKIYVYDNDEMPLTAAAPPPEGGSGGEPVNETDIHALADAAIVYWTLAGVEPESLAVLSDVTFVVVDLPGLALAEVSGTTVFVDVDAAGHGWFVDATPWESTEFERVPGTWEFVASSGPAAERMDLLTVLVHELGHLLGVPHANPRTSPHDVMLDTLPVGTRRLPTAELDVQDVPWEQIERLFARSLLDDEESL